MPRQIDPQWLRIRTELESEPCETCGASAGEHCVVIGTGRVTNIPHGDRYDKRRVKVKRELAGEGNGSDA